MHLRTALLSAGLLVLPGCMGGLTPGQVAPADIPDPTTVKRTGVPNDWLICPADTCAATASSVAPTYPIPPATMFQAWRSMLAAQPRVTVIAEDEPRLLILVQDRTPILRFVDTISIRVLPASGDGSTFAAYSKSNIGRGDFGTNRRRLEAWQGDLAPHLGPTG